MPEHAREPDDELMAAAVVFLARQREGVERILATHRRLRGGSCAACVYRSTTWPCFVASVALRARAERTPGAPPVHPAGSAVAPELY